MVPSHSFSYTGNRNPEIYEAEIKISNSPNPIMLENFKINFLSIR